MKDPSRIELEERISNLRLKEKLTYMVMKKTIETIGGGDKMTRQGNGAKRKRRDQFSSTRPQQLRERRKSSKKLIFGVGRNIMRFKIILM